MSTKPRAADPRPARTRAAIMNAVTRLAAESESGITVNAILREAGLSRGAFYDHFADLDQLAVALLRESFTQGAKSYEAELARASDIESAVRVGVRAIVEHIEHNRNFFRSGLEWRTRSEVPEKVTQMLALRLRRIVGSTHPPAAARRLTDPVAMFLAGGVIALITAWIRDSRHATVDAVTEEISDVLFRSLEAFL